MEYETNKISQHDYYFILIDIRDGAQECIGLTHNEILTFIMNICTN